MDPAEPSERLSAKRSGIVVLLTTDPVPPEGLEGIDVLRYGDRDVDGAGGRRGDRYGEVDPPGASVVDPEARGGSDSIDDRDTPLGGRPRRWRGLRGVHLRVYGTAEGSRGRKGLFGVFERRSLGGLW